MPDHYRRRLLLALAASPLFCALPLRAATPNPGRIIALE
ncbi:Fe(3+)-hydroxamate ABC transporter substrate-binding protein FhuD, partial [Kocuria rosea]